MLSPYTNVIVVCGLLGWTSVLALRAVLGREGGTSRLLLVSLALVAACRVAFMADVEPNPDTSTWLAAAATVTQRPDAGWTLLTYSDSRPLTVLPLVAALLVGAPPTYVMAESVGLLFWLGTITLCFRLLRLSVRPSVSLLGTWTLALFVATTGHGDHIGYNSEAFAVFLVTLGTYWALLMARSKHVPATLAGLGGLLLGLFPYEKMQIVPAGLLLAGFVFVVLLRSHSRLSVWSLLAGGVLPTVIISGVFAAHGEWSSFWDTYFWRYYYYSYSEEIPFSLAVDIRFRPGRILRFIFGNGWSAVYLAGLVVILIAGWIAYDRSGRPHVPTRNRQPLLLSALLLVFSLYAVIQAGNNHEHYLLLLIVPLLHAAFAAIAVTPSPFRRWLALVGISAATIQAVSNAASREPLSPRPTIDIDRKIAQLVQAETAPGQCMVVWGYADRLHVLAQRPMGHRYSNTFYVYSPLTALAEFDRRHFAEDLERNRPALFVDAMLPDISLFGEFDHQHDNFPWIATYVADNYDLLETIDGVRVYRRREKLRAPAYTASSTLSHASNSDHRE